MTDKEVVLKGLTRCIRVSQTNDIKVCAGCPYISLKRIGVDCGGVLMSDALELLMQPKREPHKKLPCTCGRIRLQLFNDFQDKQCSYYRCPKCGKEGPHAENPWAAIRDWNKMIKEEVGSNGHGGAKADPV